MHRLAQESGYKRGTIHGGCVVPASGGVGVIPIELKMGDERVCDGVGENRQHRDGTRNRATAIRDHYLVIAGAVRCGIDHGVRIRGGPVDRCAVVQPLIGERFGASRDHVESHVTKGRGLLRLGLRRDRRRDHARTHLNVVKRPPPIVGA